MSDKVISLFAARTKKEEPKGEVKEESKEELKEDSFEEVMAKNEKNNARLEKERLNANKSTLRTYRIKH